METEGRRLHGEGRGWDPHCLCGWRAQLWNRGRRRVKDIIYCFLIIFVPSFFCLRNTVCCAFSSVSFMAWNPFLTMELVPDSYFQVQAHCNSSRYWMWKKEWEHQVGKEDYCGARGRQRKMRRSVKLECPTWELLVQEHLCLMCFCFHKNGFFNVEYTLTWRGEAVFFAFALCYFQNTFLKNRY